MLISTKPRRVAALLLTGATTVAFAAACGGGSGSGNSTASGGGNGGGGNAFAAYTQCLQKNGVTITRPSGRAARPSGQPRPSGFPRPSGSAGARGGGFPGGGGFGKPAGVDDATWQKAQAACASLRPSGGPGGFRGGGGDNGANAAYRNCLQDHGVTMGQGGLNTADPATAKAIEACKVLRPTAIPTPAN